VCANWRDKHHEPGAWIISYPQPGWFNRLVIINTNPSQLNQLIGGKLARGRPDPMEGVHELVRGRPDLMEGVHELVRGSPDPM